MQKISVLAPGMKPITLIRAPVLNWELFMTGRVSFPTAGLAPLLLKVPSASFGPKKCCLPLLCREILGTALGWGAWLRLGKLGKFTFSVCWAYERLKFVLFNMVTGGKSESMLSALDGLFRNWIAGGFLACVTRIWISFKIPQFPGNGILDSELGEVGFSWTSTILFQMILQVTHVRALSFCHPEMERHLWKALWDLMLGVTHPFLDHNQTTEYIWVHSGLRLLWMAQMVTTAFSRLICFHLGQKCVCKNTDKIIHIVFKCPCLDKTFCLFQISSVGPI